MGIPWRSAESMHWQLGEAEMSQRANAPVFHLHPSVTGLSSPPSAPVAPAPTPAQGPAPPPPSHGFTPTNAPQLIPHPALPGPPQQHQQPHPPPPGPTHSYHQRSDSSSSHGRRRNSSFSRRRTDTRSRSSVPPQLGPPLPQIQAQSEPDAARTAPTPESHLGIKREGDPAPLGEPFGKRRREEEGATGRGLKADFDARSQEAKSPDRLSQRSGTGSVKSAKSARSAKSTKRGQPDDSEQASNEPPQSAA